jgi:hypothetical protein
MSAPSLGEIAARGAVRIEHDAATGSVSGSGFSISVIHGYRQLIGTTSDAAELDDVVGSVAGWMAREQVAHGRYCLDLTPLEIMGLRGTLLDRIDSQDWSW